MSRRAIVGTWAVLLLFAGPALAKEPEPLPVISFSFIEGFGSPIVSNTRNTPLFEGEADLDGWAAGVNFSLAVHKNWHVLVNYDYVDQDSDNYLGLANIGIETTADVEQTTVRFVPGFNYRVHPRVEVLIGIGFQYGGTDSVLTVDGVVDADSQDEFGVLVRAGARWRAWRGLELYSTVLGTNVAIVENSVLFDLGARYSFLRDTVALGIGTTVGTGDTVTLNLSGRIYYGEIWKWARGS